MAVKFGVAKIAGDNIQQQTTLKIPSSVEVKESLGEAISYTVVFSEDVCDSDFELIKNPDYAPGTNLLIWVEMEDKGGTQTKEYLVCGPIQTQRIKLVNGGQGSTLEVSGFDVSYKMKLDEKNVLHGDVTDAEIVNTILQGYNFKDPQVIDKKLQNKEKNHGKVQHQDDLTFLKNLAREYGFFLWISFTAQGAPIAHFNELPLDSTPPDKPALLINQTDTTLNTIDDFNISWNSDVPTSVTGGQLDTKTKKPINTAVDSAPQTKLGNITLKQIQSDEHQTGKSTHLPSDDSGHAQQKSEGALNMAEWFIQANCSTTFDRLCGVLHAHTLVNVSNVGSRHSGKYVIKGITHSINASSYKMQIELIRNAWN